MGMYKLKVILFTIGVLLLAGCGGNFNQTKLILQQVGACIDEYPDSAFFLLQSISSPSELRGKERVDYALLYTQACDKNYIPLSDDSLIQIAVDFYGGEAGINAARSYFYLGCVSWNKSNYVDAVDAFLKALEAIPPKTTDRLLMQIHVYLAESYNGERLYQDAREHYLLAYDNAAARKDITDMYYPLRGIGTSFLYLNLPDSALSYYNKALNVSCLIGNVDMEKYLLSSIAGCYELMEDYAMAGEYASKVIEMGDNDLTNMYQIKGNALMHTGALDSAYYYLSLSTSSADLNTRAIGYYNLYKLLKEKRDLRLAEYVDSLLLYKDSLNLMERYKEIQELKEEHFEQAKRQELLQHKSRLKLCSIAFCLVCLLVVIICFLIIERRRKQHYTLLQSKLVENKLDNIRKYMKGQLGETIELDIKLKELEEAEIKNCIHSFQQTIWYKKIANLDEQWLSAKEQRELFKDLSTIFADFIESLQGENPAIKDIDVYFCILSAIGYKLKIVASCLRTNDRNLSTRKSRLKKVLSKTVFDFVFVNH